MMASVLALPLLPLPGMADTVSPLLVQNLIMPEAWKLGKQFWLAT